MSADLNTAITFHGNKAELSAIMKILRNYETEKLEQYRTQRNCGYINWVTVSGESGECRTEKMTDEEIESFASTAGTKVIINASGPWGVFNFPGDVGLFEAMADVAPNAMFTGHMDGFITGADVSCSVELRDGLMHISEYAIPDEEFPELYTEDFKKKLPYAKFCKLFKVDKEEFDKDSYEEFIYEAGDEGSGADHDGSARGGREDSALLTLPEYIYATFNQLLKAGWRMNEIDEMDMLGFLRLRAWDAQRDEIKKKPKPAFIDEVWPSMKR